MLKRGNQYINSLLLVVRDAYGDDKRGFEHAVRVAANGRNQSEYVVGLCHDLVEDEYVTPGLLVGWGLTHEEIEAVDFLSRLKNQTYDEYIDRVIQAWQGKEVGGKLAVTVKFYDLNDHVHPSFMNVHHADKIPRYEKAWLKIVRLAGQQEGGEGAI